TKHTWARWPDPVNPLVGQTWPMRDAEAVSGAPRGSIMYDNYRRRLSFDLINPSVRNFYGFTHGGPDNFAGWRSADLQVFTKGRRFRFIFLDGCQSLSKANAKAFGLTDDEIAPQTLTDYRNKGLTPSAFMGNVVN